MSKMTRCYCAGTVQVYMVMDWDRKRPVLRCDQKTSNEGAEVTCWGKLFQIRTAATGKARSPTVDSRVRPTISDEDEAERSRYRTSTQPSIPPW